MTWSNRDEDWKNANSLFQRRFLCRRCPRILSSLLSLWYTLNTCKMSIFWPISPIACDIDIVVLLTIVSICLLCLRWNKILHIFLLELGSLLIIWLQAQVSRWSCQDSYVSAAINPRCDHTIFSWFPHPLLQFKGSESDTLVALTVWFINTRTDSLFFFIKFINR